MKTTRTIATWITIVCILNQLVYAAKAPKFYKSLMQYVSALPADFDKIPDDRKQALKEVADFIIDRKNKGLKTSFTIICTHNSRRSHMGQIWLKAAALYYGIDQIETFSGGTEATAFNPRAIAALERAGLKIQKIGGEEKNPKYNVSLGKDFSEMMLYSKKYSDSQNPKEDFGAIMVCSQADASCPVVPGASGRFSLPFDDPKTYDNTPQEELKYDERCKEIAIQMFYIMSLVKQTLYIESEKKK